MMTSALPLVLVVLTIGGLAATGSLLSWSPFVIGAQVAAIGLNVWARRSFQKGTFRVSAAPAGGSMIQLGPYRVIRHPMYAAALLFIWAAVISHASNLTLSIGVAVTVVCVARIIAEERLLSVQYPEYADYARSTKALVPFVF